ncbi:MAG: hypothetical protein LIR50_12810, partial [Bacillota bacterium]|nr:hypothetical protein [Bacillota bacterium]
THSKWSDEYVIKKYAKIFIKKLVDLRNKEDYFEVAKWTNYDDNDKTILEAIHNEQKYGLDNWYFDTNQSDTVGRVEQLTDLFVKELKKYPEISCTYFDIRDKNKYCSVPMNYKKTLKVELKEGKI